MEQFCIRIKLLIYFVKANEIRWWNWNWIIAKFETKMKKKSTLMSKQNLIKILRECLREHFCRVKTCAESVCEIRYTLRRGDNVASQLLLNFVNLITYSFCVIKRMLPADKSARTNRANKNTRLKQCCKVEASFENNFLNKSILLRRGVKTKDTNKIKKKPSRAGSTSFSCDAAFNPPKSREPTVMVLHCFHRFLYVRCT